MLAVGAEHRPMRIQIREDGPYVVRGGVPIRDAGGTLIQTGRTAMLCRCGASSTKPFCDDTHERSDFDGCETADKGPIESRRHIYPGEHVTILDARRICAHAAVCTDELPKVFDVSKSRWIDPDLGPAEAIADVVSRCPSGALAFALPGDPEPVEPHLEPEIRCAKDASYEVRGAIELVGADGESYERRERVTLCRCGASRNKPFCDGRHADVGFTAD